MFPKKLIWFMPEGAEVPTHVGHRFIYINKHGEVTGCSPVYKIHPCTEEEIEAWKAEQQNEV